MTGNQQDRNKTVMTTHNIAALSESPSRLIPYLSTKEGTFQDSYYVKYSFLFVLLTWYFFLLRFVLVTHWRAPLLRYDQIRDLRKQLRCIANLQRLTEEDSIFWFDLCGC